MIGLLRRGRRVAILLGLVVVAITVVAVARSTAANAIARSPNAGRAFGVADDPAPDRYRALGVDAQVRIDVTRANRPLTSLLVWLFEPAAPRGTVVLLHGIRSGKADLVALARHFEQTGYRVVLPDLPGHGGSSGDWLSYGVHETHDLRALLDALEARGRRLGDVGLLGFSYGAAVALQLAAVDERVRAVIAVAPFSTLRSVVPEYVVHALPTLGRLVPDAFVRSAVDEAGRLGGFDPDRASALDAIARTRARVLLIHGERDVHVAPLHSVALHQAAPSRGELVLVPGEDHASIFADGTGVIRGRGTRWFERWLAVSRPARDTPR